MTLLEFMDKLKSIVDNNIKIENDISKNEIYFSADDDYNQFDVKIDNIEIEDNKIFLS